MDMMKISEKNIKRLESNQVFVFGSNLSGIHGLGAAKSALKWGAQLGKGVGLHGNTYAIPTKNEVIKTLPLQTINIYVKEFIEFAKVNKELIFLVTEIGTGLAGYKINQIAPMFRDAINLDNVYLPETFWNELLNN